MSTSVAAAVWSAVRLVAANHHVKCAHPGDLIPRDEVTLPDHHLSSLLEQMGFLTGLRRGRRVVLRAVGVHIDAFDIRQGINASRKWLLSQGRIYYVFSS